MGNLIVVGGEGLEPPTFAV